jgi:hypothetical protein
MQSSIQSRRFVARVEANVCWATKLAGCCGKHTPCGAGRHADGRSQLQFGTRVHDLDLPRARFQRGSPTTEEDWAATRRFSIHGEITTRWSMDDHGNAARASNYGRAVRSVIVARSLGVITRWMCPLADRDPGHPLAPAGWGAPWSKP